MVWDVDVAAVERDPKRVPLLGDDTSAASKDMLVEQFQGFASEVLMDPVHKLVGRQRPIRLDDGPLAVQPAWLDRVEPGALHGQAAHQDPGPAGALHRAVMRPNPRLHRSADVP